MAKQTKKVEVKKVTEKMALTSPTVIHNRVEYDVAMQTRDQKKTTKKAKNNFIPTFKTCIHTGSAKVFEIAGLPVYATRKTNVRPGDDRLLLNCTDTDLNQIGIVMPESYRALQPLCLVSTCINMQWQDQGTPEVDPVFWVELVRHAIKNRETGILVFCLGSHGRTGTALAALLIANQGMSAHEAVQTVRKNHCEDCIESQSQIRYLRELAEYFNCSDPVKDFEITGSYHRAASKFTPGFTGNQYTIPGINKQLPAINDWDE